MGREGKRKGSGWEGMEWDDEVEERDRRKRKEKNKVAITTERVALDWSRRKEVNGGADGGDGSECCILSLSPERCNNGFALCLRKCVVLFSISSMFFFFFFFFILNF